MIGDGRKELIKIAKKAGLEILKYYAKDIKYKLKKDFSPITEADLH